MTSSPATTLVGHRDSDPPRPQSALDEFSAPLSFRPHSYQFQTYHINGSTPTLAGSWRESQDFLFVERNPVRASNMSGPTLYGRDSHIPLAGSNLAILADTEGEEEGKEFKDYQNFKDEAMKVPQQGPPQGPPGPRGPPGGPPDLSDQLYRPKTVKFWLVMLSNFMAMFLVALDRTIIATAIPRITDDFNTLGDIGWYGSAYMLTTAASQLLFGRIFRFYNVKWTFLVCIIVFEVGSVICAAAPTSPIFIAGRAIAGFGSAGIFTGAMMIMIPMIPLHKRPMFQSVFGMVFGFASVVGPLIGGGFTGAVSWRWCFWINLPVGGVAFIALVAFLHDPPKPKQPPATVKQQIMRLDPLGTFFFLPAITSLLLALQWGGSQYAWNDTRIVVLFVVFAVMTVCFCAVQVLMPESATLPVRVVKNRSMLAGAFYMIFLSGALIMAIYYVPLWFQTVQNVDPVQSGIYIIPLVISIVISSILSGVATQKLGYYVPSMILSPCLMAIGEGLLSTLRPNTGSPHWIGYQFITGFGLGFGMQTVNLAAQTVLPREDISTGVALSFFSQQLGAAIFMSVGQAILSNILVGQLADIPGLRPESILHEGATDLRKVVPERFVGAVIESYNFALTRIFLVGLGLCFATLFCALCMQWKSIKKNQPGPPGGGPPGMRPGGPEGPGLPGGPGQQNGFAAGPKPVKQVDDSPV